MSTLSIELAKLWFFVNVLTRMITLFKFKNTLIKQNKEI
jgi:hypothetical protein